MKTTLFTVILIMALHFAFGQNIEKNYYPKTVKQLNLTSKKDKDIQRQSELLKQDKLSKTEKKELDKLLEKYKLIGSMWDIIGEGCSWYCDGGNYKVQASSNLSPEKEIKYIGENANDLSYKTAWVEGKADEGIGEYLEYYFKNDSPRITKIIISNGYLKSETAWKNNNRVKKLRLIVNGKSYGILNLNDSRTDQTFELGTFGRNADGTDLILRFEIVEVFKGEKFNDTAITEIYFDGIDVH